MGEASASEQKQKAESNFSFQFFCLVALLFNRCLLFNLLISVFQRVSFWFIDFRMSVLLISALRAWRCRLSNLFFIIFCRLVTSVVV
jgi:hypothetical protein